MPFSLRLLSLILLCLVAPALQADDAAPAKASAPAVIHYEAALDRIVVRPTKADGRAWDAFGGRPDLQVVIRNLRTGSSFDSPVAANRCEHVFGVLTGPVNIGDTLEIDVWDKDISYHDHVGLKRLELTSAVLEHGSVDLVFGQVSMLRVKFFPVRTSTSLLVEPRPEERPFSDVRIATLFEQRAPSTTALGASERSRDQARAIVLIHGFRGHPFDGGKVFRPYFDCWQEPHSTLVKSLVEVGDVYGYSYGQNGSLAQVCAESGLRDGVARLKKMGYREVVLVGHSAGGVIARDLVETHPDCGVTGVIQICAPNAGACAAHAGFVYPVRQSAFLRSLTPQVRMVASARRDAKVPEHVRFVCLVGTFGRWGDGLLSCNTQWPADLQEQGIPADVLPINHHFSMGSDGVARKLVELIEQPTPRWTASEVADMRETLFGVRDR